MLGAATELVRTRCKDGTPHASPATIWAPLVIWLGAAEGAASHEGLAAKKREPTLDFWRLDRG